MRAATFNVNNLFSRYNFSAEVDALPPKDSSVEMTVSFDPTDPGRVWYRTYKGKLVKGKPAADRTLIGQRILRMDADVVAVQEVEDIDTLTWFVREDLGGAYAHLVLVEGNDERLIDVAVISRYPIGQVTSWRHAVYQPSDTEPVFSRDLLQVEVLNRTRSRRLFTLFNNHLKSRYCDWREPDQDKCIQANNARRQHQAETAAQIIATQMGKRAGTLSAGT